MSASRTRLVCLGVISGSRGLKGEIRIKSFTEDPATFGTYGPFTDKSGEQTIDIVVIGSSKGQIAARIEGVNDRSAADALKGTELYVDRSALPEPEADEFYHLDLIGLRAERKDGVTVGTVKKVEDYGAGPLLEIEVETETVPEMRGLEPVVLVPFTRQAVPEVDLKAGVIVIDPTPGILEPLEDEDGAKDDDGKNRG